MKLFKFFIKERIKNKAENIKNLGFWNRFSQGYFNPPFNFFDDIANESIEFRSVNSLYIIWIFQNEFSTELYKEFIKSEGESLFQRILDSFGIIENEDLKIAKYYIINFFSIFSFENNYQKGK